VSGPKHFRYTFDLIQGGSGASAPEKFTPLAVVAQGIPKELRQIPNWVNWQLVFKEGATKPWTKVPKNPLTGGNAATDAPSTWTTFEAALAASPRHAGIGFVFTEENGLVGVDLDHCRDPKTGAIEVWARRIVNQLESYTEVTPSGTGLHIIVRGEIPEGRRKWGNIEMYSSGRYFTFTGRHLEGTPLVVEARTESIGLLHSSLDEEPKKKEWPRAGHNSPRPAPASAPASAPDADDDLLERAKRWRNGDKTADLWNGVWEARFTSQSEADQSFCDTLAFLYDKDAARIDRMFRRSGLMREKWDESHRGDGATYGAITIEKAIAGTRDTYKPRGEMGGSGVARPALPSASSLNYRRADQIEAEDIQWIWPGVLAVGKLTIFAGDPKVGKTLAAEYIATRRSTGGQWPDGGSTPIGNTFLIEVEDAESDTTVPRLTALGADTSRIFVYGPQQGDVTDQDGSKRAFSLDRDLPALRQALIDTQSSVLIISPVMTFMGGKDSMRDQEVRQVLTPLVAMAAELKIAVVAVIHLNKADDKKAIHRIQASMAFAAVARIVRVFVKDPDEKDRRLMLSIGGNNTADNEATPAYRIIGWCWHCKGPAGKLCETCGKPSTAKMEWGESVEGVDAERLMGRPVPVSEEERSAPKADALLYEMVPDSTWVPAREVYAEGEKRGITDRSIKAAKYRQRLGSDRQTFTGGWYWFRNQESVPVPEGEETPRARARVDRVVPDPWDTHSANKSIESTKRHQGTPTTVKGSLGLPLGESSSPKGRPQGTPLRLLDGGLDSKGENTLRTDQGTSTHGPTRARATRATGDDPPAQAPGATDPDDPQNDREPWSLL
jgi:putative DNA primase/helicase